MAAGRQFFVGFWTLFVTLLTSSYPSWGSLEYYGPFAYDKDIPSVVVLFGPIEERSALNFRRLLRAAPNARTLVLDSPGGLVAEALLIADDVQEQKLGTLIPPDGECFSACAFIFLAGADRTAAGALGVHQISSDSPDLERAQLAISDIIDALDRFGTPAGVLTAMFRTSANQMHVFDQEEIALYGINRTRAGSGEPASYGKLTQRLMPDGAETQPGNSDLPLPPWESLAEADPPTGQQPHRVMPPSQRLVFYQERTESAPGTQETGSVVWSFAKEASSDGTPAEPVIRAVANIPDEGLMMTLTLRRNRDRTLPATHVIEMVFNPSTDFSGRAITSVNRPALKTTEQERGEPLIGIAGKITENTFIIALNSLEQAQQKNITLLRDKSWIDIPIMYATGRRALMTLEKGNTGASAFEEALSAWSELSHQ